MKPEFKEFIEEHSTFDSPHRALLEWAFEEAETLKDAQDRLKEVNCAGCSGPAPIYNYEVAQEMAKYWSYIQDALEEYEDATGEYWTPKDGNFLQYVWFTYEWFASDLARKIEDALEESEEK